MSQSDEPCFHDRFSCLGVGFVLAFSHNPRKGSMGSSFGPGGTFGPKKKSGSEKNFNLPQGNRVKHNKDLK
jgi:hypothetical protein